MVVGVQSEVTSGDPVWVKERHYFEDVLLQEDLCLLGTIDKMIDRGSTLRGENRLFH